MTREDEKWSAVDFAAREITVELVGVGEQWFIDDGSARQLIWNGE